MDNVTLFALYEITLMVVMTAYFFAYGWTSTVIVSSNMYMHLHALHCFIYMCLPDMCVLYYRIDNALLITNIMHVIGSHCTLFQLLCIYNYGHLH